MAEIAQPSAQDEAQAADGEEVRCICNKLICKRYGDMIEIKCSKCKRMIRIETEGIVDIQID